MVYTARVCRLLSPCTPRTLKQWLACRIDHGKFTSHELAERAEIRHDLLRKFANDSQHEQIPFVGLVRVCRVLDDWTAFDLVLVPEGYRLAKVDRVDAPSCVTTQTLELAAQAGRTVAAVQEAQSDGQIDVHDEARVRQHISALRREADDLELALPSVGRVQ
jgi:DNA-binding Xre family transcriptional regulator